MSMYSKINKILHREKYRVLVSGIGVAIVVGVYLFGTTHEPGLLSYLLALPAMLGILLTSLAKVNDIGPAMTGLKWQAHRIALTMVGAAMVAYMYAPWSTYPAYPTWLAAVTFWGFFAVWAFEQKDPPWHKYITGKIRLTKSGKVVKVS